MINTISLEQVELITAQLPPQEQLRLVARISERLSALNSFAPEMADEAAQRARAVRAEAVLALCDDAAERFVGESNAAEEIRLIRDERIEPICQSNALREDVYEEPSKPVQETDAERQRREYAARVEAFLKLCDENAAEAIGEVDAAEDIRQIREERMSQL